MRTADAFGTYSPTALAVIPLVSTTKSACARVWASRALHVRRLRPGAVARSPLPVALVRHAREENPGYHMQIRSLRGETLLLRTACLFSTYLANSIPTTVDGKVAPGASHVTSDGTNPPGASPSGVSKTMDLPLPLARPEVSVPMLKAPTMVR